MERFVIDLADMRDEHPKVEEDVLVQATKVYAGILAAVDEIGWREGYRNNMAVDFSIACWLMDVDPSDKLAAHLTKADEYDANDRFDVISNYLEDWEKYGIDDYWIDADEWERWYDNTEGANQYLTLIDTDQEDE